MHPKALIKSSKRIVLKIGSVLLADEVSGEIRREWLQSLSNDIADLLQDNKEIVIVSSGAIALGRNALNIPKNIPPSSIPLEQKQAAAAAGQIEISRSYHNAFSQHGIKLALILLTPSDTENRRSHLNARSTIETLISKRLIPIINENDTVSTAEIRFGDNDRLAARVAQMIGADLLIQLSTIDGLYTADPTKDKSAQHIELVETLNSHYSAMAKEAPAGLSTGGMIAKIEAAKLATAAGTHMVIAKGTENNPLTQLQKEQKATVFLANDKPQNAKKRWIATHLEPTGSVTIDEGAEQALRSGKSLLPIGILKVEGNFNRGDALNIMNNNQQKLAVGLSAYNTQDTQKIAGKNSSEIEELLGYAGRSELIHRDDLVLLG